MLWVSYADPATVRQRLAGLAQEVHSMLEQSGLHPLPRLILPPGARVRHGFWFMRFEKEAQQFAARRQLNGFPFASDCGTLTGTLAIDLASRELDLRGFLNADETAGQQVDGWLAHTFSQFGHIESVKVPRLVSNWDPGHGAIQFTRSEDALRALEALDGTPSCIPGCNLAVDFALKKPLAAFQHPGPQPQSLGV